VTLLQDLDRGDKRAIHINLYEDEIVVLDTLAGRYNCSRAAIIGALLQQAEADKTDFTDDVPVSGKPDRVARRPGAGRPPFKTDP
jgi:hypothetical protein